MITVTNRRPKATEIAIGMRNCAWKLLLSIRGARPATVVTDVRIMGLNLFIPAFQMLSSTENPFFRYALYAATNTSASFTRIPIKCNHT